MNAPVNKAIQEVINHNINSYVNEKEPIRLSDAIAKDEQKGIVIYLEVLSNITRPFINILSLKVLKLLLLLLLLSSNIK